MSLAGRRALITGSTSGIGAGIAEELCIQGCEVVLHGLGDPEQIEALRKRLEVEYDVKVEFVEGDLSTRDGVAQMISAACAGGPIDILVNNAGVQHVSPVEDFPPEK